MKTFIIHALNPGYTTDAGPNAGEFIELTNLTGAPLSLAGFSLTYTNSSGNSVPLIEFPEGSVLTGENLLIRYYNAPDAKLSDLTYTTQIALDTGPLELRYNGEVVDAICWTGKSPCFAKFDSKSPTSLVRDIESGKFLHDVSYQPSFEPGRAALILPTSPPADDETEKPLAGNLNAVPSNLAKFILIMKPLKVSNSSSSIILPVVPYP